MKKLMYLELCVMVVVLIVAIAVGSYLTSPAFSPDSFYAGNYTPNSTENNPLEATVSWKTFPDDRQILAQQYFVYDCSANKFLTISGQENDLVYPASITKLFTALVVMQYLQPDTVYVADDVLDLVVPGSSVAGLKKGDALTGRQFLEAMLLSSGNDAAYVLACEAGRVIAKDPYLGAVAAVQVFVQEMNRHAKDAGMENTNFVNPDGIHHPEHYSTFKDLATLGALCMENTTIMRTVAVAKSSVTIRGEKLEWENTNLLIDSNSPYYCPYATGLKTGQTPAAGSCLLSSFRKSGKFLLIGVFGCPENNDRFDDTLQLFNQTVLN